jgi:hypothetical protein
VGLVVPISDLQPAAGAEAAAWLRMQPSGGGRNHNT